VSEHEAQVVISLALHHQLHRGTEAAQQAGHRLNLAAARSEATPSQAARTHITVSCILPEIS
jgi:hypothetical protein